MIIRVLNTGKDAPGLMRYGFSQSARGEQDERRTNVHTNPHLVAGSGSLAAEWSGELTSKEATQLGRLVESSWRARYAEQLASVGAGSGGISRSNLTGPDAQRSGRDHVFHAALSLHADDPSLTDEQWQAVASEYVDGMGFTEGGPGVGCTWVAFHHGESEHGNDHIHVVVNLVREDGGWASTSFSKKESQRVRRELEARHDFLRPLHDPALSAEQQRDAREPVGLPGYVRGELRRANQRQSVGAHEVEPDRVHLQRVVRGAAQAATTEAEFLYGVLERGIDIEPRWAAGGRTDVVGYSVQVPVPDGVSPAGADERVRYGGKKLAPDLTLPQLRARWTGNETDESREAAMAIWRGEVPVLPAAQDAPGHLREATAHLSAWNDRLAGTDVRDRAAWKRETAHAAGTMSLVASGLAGPEGVQLGRAADRFARVSLAVPAHRADAPPVPRAGLSEAELAARHLNLALRAGGTDAARGWMAVMQQMSRTTKAIQDAHAARYEMVAATRTLAGVPAAVGGATNRFEQVARLEEIPADIRADARKLTARGPGTTRPHLGAGKAVASEDTAQPTVIDANARTQDNDQGM
ncbi:hypothetical protein [Allobranchiibius sp. GilTou38]|uniref:relaxase/mobilization nuclease domain-containing protein n=1 Tax=Allobranchiibius sp. GilTou38 TaxID=2815210 RepID=UPI001AA146C3|nr:hypothetical protein [Allobranchiibius sp. GilTou38]MBO1768247.1 hypothetical protein [Allobranchiibius sp. GilTou38]